MNKNELQKINIENLVWNPGKREQPVLDHINSMLTSDNFYGILGPNGAGKTSLVRQILKLKQKDEGDISLDERSIYDIKREEMAKNLSFLPQNLRADVDFTVFDVVAMGREPHRKRFLPLDAKDIACIEEALEFTNCTALKEKNISVLSGGERQRVMIARTIAQDTPWVILDEPVSNLDVRHQIELMQVLHLLREKKGKTIIAILHDINLAANFCTHILLMKDGKVFKSGITKDVLTKENLKAVYEMDFDFVANNERETEYIVPVCYA